MSQKKKPQEPKVKKAPPAKNRVFKIGLTVGNIGRFEKGAECPAEVYKALGKIADKYVE